MELVLLICLCVVVLVAFGLGVRCASLEEDLRSVNTLLHGYRREAEAQHLAAEKLRVKANQASVANAPQPKKVQKKRAGVIASARRDS